MGQGLYKKAAGPRMSEDSAWVRYPSGHEMEKPRSKYEADGDQPAFDSLPDKEAFQRKNAAKS